MLRSSSSQRSGVRRNNARRGDARRGDASFNSKYFQRYYFDPRTRVTDASEMRRRADLIATALVAAQIPVRTILDAGCGIGLLRKAFARALPRARYTGLEASEYLCRRYGWLAGDIATYDPPQPFDLVVCYDVLQYLDDAQAARSLARFAALSRAALYFSALTREDWRRNCDRSRTDRDVHLRTGEWYRRRLQRHFTFLGFGVWVRKSIAVIRWELESSP